MADDDEPKPGLLVLDMLNENLESVSFNKATMIENCRQLALSDFFHVCIDSNPVVPQFRAKSAGAQLVNELKGMEHFNHIPKKNNSALDGTNVLETLRSLGVTHVCVCGTSAELAVLETVRDLKKNGFEVFVVKDAISSKNGQAGYNSGMAKIRSEFGDDVIVGISDLLGDEEIVEEEIIEEEVIEEKAPTKATAAAAKTAPPAKKSKEPAPASSGGLFGCCMGGGVEGAVATQTEKLPAPATTASTTPSSTKTPAQSKATAATPAAAPRSIPASAPTPAAAKSSPTAKAPEPAAPAPEIVPQSTVREERKPGWAGSEKASASGAADIAPAPAPALGARPAKNVPAGFVSGTRKDQEISSGVQDRIAGLANAGLATTNKGGKRMKTPRIITDTKESWDREGNITREITRYITEPDGTKRTEKETVYIPAEEAEQQ
jgi:nicotinamidase-related amidase